MKIKWNDIVDYFRAKIRYHAYYSERFNKKIPMHIKAQFELRLRSMNKKCYKDGSCIKCGCTTTELQMANKGCEGLCYPPMLNQTEWANIRYLNTLYREGDTGRYWTIKDNKWKVL